MRYDNEEEETRENDREWSKERRKQRFKNKKRDRKRFERPDKFGHEDDQENLEDDIDEE